MHDHMFDLSSNPIVNFIFLLYEDISEFLVDTRKLIPYVLGNYGQSIFYLFIKFLKAIFNFSYSIPKLHKKAFFFFLFHNFLRVLGYFLGVFKHVLCWLKFIFRFLTLFLSFGSFIVLILTALEWNLFWKLRFERFFKIFASSRMWPSFPIFCRIKFIVLHYTLWLKI